MKKYKVVILVDEERLVKQVSEHDQCGTSVRGAIEHEFGWLEESGIELERLAEVLYPDCDCTSASEHEEHTIICDHCDKRADEGEITEIKGKWTCDKCYSRMYL